MDDIERCLADSAGPDEKDGYPLMSRTRREQWEIPASLRGPLLARLSQIICDPNSPHREVLSAVSAIMTASKVNLANIDLTMKVQKHEELERRMTEIERKLDASDAGNERPG